MKKIAVAMGIAALSGAALAQGITVTSVQGAATVTSGSQGGTIVPNMALTEGASVMVAPGGSVTISFPNGCTATIAGGGAAFVVSEANCRALATQTAGGGAGAGTDGNLGTIGLVGGIAIGSYAIYEATKSDSNPPPAAQPGPTQPTPSSPAPTAPAKPKPNKPAPISPT